MSRNANGDGSIWLRKDGRWCGGAYVRTVGNRVERRYVYGRTRKEVVAKLVDLQKRHNDGYAAGSTTLTVGTTDAAQMGDSRVTSALDGQERISND